MGSGSVSIAFESVRAFGLALDPVPMVLATVDTPSTNLVLKITLALLNIPSFSDTTMNWLCEK